MRKLPKLSSSIAMALVRPCVPQRGIHQLEAVLGLLASLKVQQGNFQILAVGALIGLGLDLVAVLDQVTLQGFFDCGPW